jgi:hypothetical protein
VFLDALSYVKEAAALYSDLIGSCTRLYEALCQKLSTTLVKVRWKFSDDAL